MAKCGEIEKTRWWIVIIFGVTLWGSQPRYGAAYVLGVDVITEEVEDIDVDFFLTFVSIYSILIVQKMIFFPEMNYS